MPRAVGGIKGGAKNVSSLMRIIVFWFELPVIRNRTNQLFLKQAQNPKIYSLGVYHCRSKHITRISFFLQRQNYKIFACI